MYALVHWQVTLSGSDFDTLLAVYTGTVVNALTRVANNDDCTTDDVTSCVTFTVVPGSVYSIQVDGPLFSVGLRQGTVRIAVSFVWPAPRNDAFSAAGTTFPADGTTLGATMETGERVAILGRGASASVWYRFSAAADGNMKVLGPGHLETPHNAPIPKHMHPHHTACSLESPWPPYAVRVLNGRLGVYPRRPTPSGAAHSSGPVGCVWLVSSCVHVTVVTGLPRSRDSHAPLAHCRSP